MRPTNEFPAYRVNPEPKKGTARRAIFYTLAGIFAFLALVVPAANAVTCAILALAAVIIAKE